MAADRQSTSADELTGAYLRHPGLLQFERDLSRAQRNGESLVVAFIDVDQLKAANGRGGHKAGDRLLWGVAGAMRAHLRQPDQIICVGGVESVCVVAGLDRDDVADALLMPTPRLPTGPNPVRSPPGAPSWAYLARSAQPISS